MDGKVYAAGFDTPKFDRRVIMWSDGQQEYLTDGSSDALAYCICADGKDIYVGGYIQPADNKSGGIATIWKNGVAQSLTDGSTVAKVNAICVDNGKVYAAGAEKYPADAGRESSGSTAKHSISRKRPALKSADFTLRTESMSSQGT